MTTVNSDRWIIGIRRATDVSSVEQFLAKYYKPDRYTGRGEEYAEYLLQSYKDEVFKNGFAIIASHDNITGEVIAFHSSHCSCPDCVEIIFPYLRSLSRRLIKVEALETNQGVQVGSRVRSLPFRTIDGDNFPVVTGTVTQVDYLLDYTLSYYRLHVECDPGQSIGRLESAEHHFEVIE